MFKKKDIPAFAIDWTKGSRVTSGYRYGRLKEFGLAGDVTALAVDPVGGWLAAGSSCGTIHLIGSPGVSTLLSVYHAAPNPISKGTTSVKFLCFHPGWSRLVAIDSKQQLHVWDLSVVDPRTKLPHKDATLSLFGTVTAIDLPSPSTSHLAVTLKDGTTLFLDLARQAHLSPYRIPNVWALHEARLRRSGLETPHRLGQPMATAIAINPRDLNLVLIGYEGGVVLWDLQKNAADRTFQLILPPGSPGGGTYFDDNLFTERSPGVTTLCWKPDGLVFAVGHDDGCIAIWAVEDSDKPLSVRTVILEDVNVTDAEALFESGVLDKQEPSGKSMQVPIGREPIFKLSWASFPDQATLKAIAAAEGTEAAGEPVSAATYEYADRGETILVVLGGLLPTDEQGVTVLQFPAYNPPTANVRPPNLPGASQISSVLRSAFRDSLSITGSTLYPTSSPCEDFILLPRSSPYYSLCHDPIAIIFMLAPDPKLPAVSGPQSAHRVAAYTFPPTRSDDKPLASGRKEFRTPGYEDAYTPMTAAPQSPTQRRSPSLPGSPRSRSSSPKIPSPRPASPRGSISRFSFGRRPTSPVPSTFTPAMGKRGYGTYRMPTEFLCGGDAIAGCEVFTPPAESFRRAIVWTIELAGLHDRPRLPLRGGQAYPDLESPGAPDLRAAKLESYRLMCSWHIDGTVRFYDISSQLLVLPSPLTFEYPAPLPHLTVDIRALLRDKSLSHLPAAKQLAQDPASLAIRSVNLATSTLELAVTLSQGQVLYFQFGEAKPGHSDDDDDVDDFRLDQEDLLPSHGGRHQQQTARKMEEITSLAHLARWGSDGFKPVWIMDLNQGPVEACAVSDVGFLAVSYARKSLCIVDLRGPEIILREGFAEEGEKYKGGESGLALSLNWAICGLGPDSTPLLRLFTHYRSGHTKIFLLVHGLAGWMVEKKPYNATHDSLIDPIASFVLDGTSGEELKPNADRLIAAMEASDGLASREQTGSSSKGTTPVHCVWIAAGRRGLRAQINVSGERIAKVELEEDLRNIFLVTRHANKILVAFTESASCNIYSVPSLDLVLRLPLQAPLGRLSMDLNSGDYLEQHSPLAISLRTLFDFRRPLDPRPVYETLPKAVPAQPLPVSSTILASWLGTWGGGTMTGAQVDALIAGPTRPLPAPRPDFLLPPSNTGANQVSSSTTAAIKTGSQRARKPAPAASNARERRDIYSEMTEAAEERGNILDGLSETMQNMGRQASEMAKQGQRLAAKESAKATARSWLPF